jgi:hypothetical protein
MFTYSLLNLIIVAKGVLLILQSPLIWDWQQILFTNHNNNLLQMLGIAALLFPKLALGLSEMWQW